MHLDQEDIDAIKGRHAEDRQDFLEAKAKVDHEIPDHLAKPFRHRFVGDKMEIASFADDLSSYEMFKLAKLVERMAEAKQSLERTEALAKKQGVAL